MSSSQTKVKQRTNELPQLFIWKESFTLCTHLDGPNRVASGPRGAAAAGVSSSWLERIAAAVAG